MALIVAGRLTPPNVKLLRAARDFGVEAHLLPADVAQRRAAPGDVVLGRVDVLPSLDGVEPGLLALRKLEAAGIEVLNRAEALYTAHDKRRTAERFRMHGVPHPRTVHVRQGDPLPRYEGPVVLKPRFGSWGADVVRCDSRRALKRAFSKLARRPWFHRDGVLVQELIPPTSADLRVLVACGDVVGAVSRHVADGEWRTNVALGATRRPTIPSVEACSLAVTAAAAVGGDLVGIDLLPTPSGYVVLEVNGCVDFTSDYSFPESNVFDEVTERILFPAIAQLEALVLGPQRPTPDAELDWTI